IAQPVRPFHKLRPIKKPSILDEDERVVLFAVPPQFAGPERTDAPFTPTTCSALADRFIRASL
ncbi:MAG TPA: hypothetical protein VFN23_16115, partial [Ktedonobacteraceae bacterium]|nr:hypothetical protein [Ktedonobacteraceae bacterium]